MSQKLNRWNLELMGEMWTFTHNQEAFGGVDIKDQLPGLDFGLSVDVEWRLPMLSIAARYTHGLTDLRQAGTDEAVYSRVLTGTGRIYLGKKTGDSQAPSGR